MSQNRWIPAAALAGLLFSMPHPGWAQLATTRIATGVFKPTYVTYLPGDSQRVFVLEQNGVIRIINNGSLTSRPFLDIQGIVNHTGDEQGLLGLAFDPDFATNKHFFVYYTGGSSQGTAVIRRYTVSSDPDSADVNSGVQIMVVQENVIGQLNHKGGTIQFDPDGYLRWGLGDGGGGGDPGENGQDGSQLLGKILRIDPDSDAFPLDPLQNYAIPASNPFVNDPGNLVRDEIWAIGMRNPYRWTFDRLTGEMYIADVGQQSWEEIDYEPAGFPGGRNYGWDLVEGFHCFEPPSNCDDGDPVLTYPIYEYPSTGAECSITGGVVYHGSQFPYLQGQYFFGDYCSGKVWSILVNGGAVVDTTNHTGQISPSLDGFIINQLVGIGEDNDGELYLLDRGSTVTPTGSVFKVVKDPDFVGVDIGTPAPGAAALELSRVNPNPFRNSTSFDVQLSRDGNLEVGVYTASGQLLRRIHSGSMTAGRHSFTWDGSNERSIPAVAGVYFIRAEGLGSSATKRVTLLR
jgi:glucose/arabinose dehydrogenase